MALVSLFHRPACTFVLEIRNQTWAFGRRRQNAESIVLRCAHNGDGQAKTCITEAEEVNNMEMTDTSAAQTAPHGQKERRKIVKIAWEKLVRWSRSWRLLNARRATNVLQTTKKVVVLGGGSFGTAMAALVAKNKADMEVSMLIRDADICQSINESHLN
eukprot:Gb_40053 [translate_table: standard]